MWETHATRLALEIGLLRQLEELGCVSDGTISNQERYCIRLVEAMHRQMIKESVTWN